VVNGKTLGNKWGEPYDGGRWVEISDVKATRRRVIHIGESLKVTDLATGSTLMLNSPFVDNGDYVLHLTYGEHLLVVLSPESLSVRGKEFLSESVHEDWGYPLEAFEFEELKNISLPPGRRGRLAPFTLEKIQEEYDAVFKSNYKILNLETNETIQVMDLRTWLPAPNSGYIIVGGDLPLILASRPFLDKHLGKRLGAEVIGAGLWGWPTDRQYATHGYEAIFKAGWFGWYLVEDAIGECVEEFNRQIIEITDASTGATRLYTKGWLPNANGVYILSSPNEQWAVVIAHQKWLEENTGRLLGIPINEDWGWSLCVGISNEDWGWPIRGELSDGWRGQWITQSDIPTVLERFNVVEEFNRQIIEVLDIDTGETHRPRRWVPNYNGAYILSTPEERWAVILAHQKWIKENTGRTLGALINKNWGWHICEGINGEDWVSSVVKELSNDWRGWWVLREDIPAALKRFNTTEEVIL
jgi:hypothetical protein